MPSVQARQDSRRIYTVAELTRLIKSAIEGAVGDVWIEGEMSNLRQPASGHFYFTIKDETSQIAAVMFRGNQRDLRFPPKDGTFVRAFGAVTVYERNGNYQIIVRRMEEGGAGSLQARFEALKEKLRQEGLFEASRKKALPVLPQHVGIVTSPTGAAIRDILTVVSRRFPNLHLVLAPVKVQGQGAAEEIAAAIDLLNARGGLDVLIVGRGGGSVEDLWCFNEEVVARAIGRSRLPVISAVGHESDFTISDFVADVRAPTPSAAAEIVVGRKDAFEESLAAVTRRLVRGLRHALLESRNRLLAAGGSAVFREPAHLVGRHRQRLDALTVRSRHEARNFLHERQQRLDEMATGLAHAVAMRRQACGHDVRRLTLQLRALNPLGVLNRGYSVTRNAAGRLVRSTADVGEGERIRTQVANGDFESQVCRGSNGKGGRTP